MKITLKTFPGHAGRPGQQGGSLPRSNSSIRLAMEQRSLLQVSADPLADLVRLGNTDISSKRALAAVNKLTGIKFRTVRRLHIGTVTDSTVEVIVEYRSGKKDNYVLEA